MELFMELWSYVHGAIYGVKELCTLSYLWSFGALSTPTLCPEAYMQSGLIQNLCVLSH